MRKTRLYRSLSVSGILLLLAVCVLGASILSADFAEWFSLTVSAVLRQFFAIITCLLPFSLAECLVILLPVAFLVLLCVTTVRSVKSKSAKPFARLFLGLLSLLMLLSACFIVTFGVCYRRKPCEARIGLASQEVVTHETIERAALLLICKAKTTLNDVAFAKDGSSAMPYGFRGLCTVLASAYHERFSQSPRVFSVKPVMLSEPWTYTHTAGIYMPFTGESNVNVNYPAFILAYTTAHEMAHQMGIASEDEANFYAFLACMDAHDAYLVYAGCLNVIDYMLADLPTDAARRVMSAMPDEMLGELASYAAFFRKYASSKAAVVAEAVNDSYLKSQGVSEGTKSYGKVTSLAVRYLVYTDPTVFSPT